MNVVCAYCGKEFETRRKNKKYCSRECCQEQHKADMRIRYVGKREKNCRFCGKALPKFKSYFCDGECKRRWHCVQKGLAQSYEETERVCIVCGNHFFDYKQNRVTCSAECARQRRINPRYKGITVDRGITLAEVVKRDNQICQLCGGMIDWNDYVIKNGAKICGNAYPSIDHIVPISRGGVHAWGNVQLAHRGCNSSKCNRFVG